MNIKNLTKLQKEATHEILSLITDLEGFYVSDFITEYSGNFEMITQYEAREFIINNISEVLDSLEDIQENWGTDVLFENGLDLHKVANFSYLNIVERVYYQIINGLEAETEEEFWNSYLKEGDEQLETLKTFIRNILK